MSTVCPASKDVCTGRHRHEILRQIGGASINGNSTWGKPVIQLEPSTFVALPQFLLLSSLPTTHPPSSHEGMPSHLLLNIGGQVRSTRLEYTAPYLMFGIPVDKRHTLTNGMLQLA
jgi:hypothetical protein